MAFRLVVGLGNPGERYRNTRHNIGFDVLDEVARRAKVNFKTETRGPVEQVKVGETVLLKPLTFMNESGVAVKTWLDWLKWNIEEVLVVSDDIAMPLGQIRIRGEGGFGGHNGLASIIETIGTEKFARIRCGIGPQPPMMASEDYVLAKFSKEQGEGRAAMIIKAADAIEACQKLGVEAAMNQFNKKITEKNKEPNGDNTK